MTTFTGTIGADTILGTSGDDIISGLDGNDSLSGGDGNDSIDGGDGNDWIDGGKGNDTLIGGNGADTIIGSGDDDTIIGGSGNDSIQGTNGADTIQYSGNGNGYDAVDGGTSILDKIVATSQNTVIGLTSVVNVETVDGFSDGTTAIKGSTGADSLNFSTTVLNNIAYIDGGDGDDTITGSTSADTIRGNAGNDTLIGNNAADVFQYASTTDGFDIVDGSGGNDKIVALNPGTVIGLISFTSIETIDANNKAGVSISGDASANSFDFTSTTLVGIASINGGDGNDTITGSSVADTILGGLGDDLIIFNPGLTAFDSIDGGGGADTIQATADGTAIKLSGVTGVELITSNTHTGVSILGSSGNDNLNFNGTTLDGIAIVDAGAGDDSVTGSSGNDSILSGLGNDTVDGGSGNDTFQYYASNGTDSLSGGLGSDNIVVLADNADLIFTHLDGVETLNLSTHIGVTIEGTSGDDSIILPASQSGTIASLVGGDGDDTIQFSGQVSGTVDGGSGNDNITGGTFNDSIYMSAGSDTIKGGYGADKFIFENVSDSVIGSGRDLIDDFDGNLTYEQVDLSDIGDFTFIGNAAFTGSAGQLRYDGAGTGLYIVQGDIDGDGAADFEFKMHYVGGAISSNDFILT